MKYVILLMNLANEASYLANEATADHVLRGHNKGYKNKSTNNFMRILNK